MIHVGIDEETYCAAVVALEYLAEHSTDELAERMKKAKKNLKEGFYRYCAFHLGDEMPALLRKQAT